MDPSQAGDDEGMGPYTWLSKFKPLHCYPGLRSGIHMSEANAL
ncbi:MAG: hypothetical protein ACI955_001894 [Zhongshania sp.]|jgi:hypothetical protein